MFHLIATFAVGLGVAGLILGLSRLLGRKPPRYLAPLLAGVSMLVFAVWKEYTWDSRIEEGLPDHVVVVKRISASVAWAPWTHLLPRPERLVAINTAETRPHAEHPGHFMVQRVLIGRGLEAAVIVHQLYDCPGRRAAEITPATLFRPDGLPEQATWQPVGPQTDALYPVVCAASARED